MILDALQYNPSVRAVDLSGNRISEAHLTNYLSASKHEKGLPTLAMIMDGQERADAARRMDTLRRVSETASDASAAYSRRDALRKSLRSAGQAI